jgi:hypothetical protein
LVKIVTMRDGSNLTIYIVAGVILAHFLIGLIYLIYKMTKKKTSFR